MGWIEDVKGKIVCLDTAPVIYYLEAGLPEYKKALDPFFDMVAEDKCLAVTSAMALLEGLVLPFRNNDAWLIRRYRNFFYGTRIKTAEITTEIAEQASRLRASYTDINLKSPDAIQIATALQMKADFFLTNDKQLSSISEIKVLILDDLKAKPGLDAQTMDS